MLKVTNSLRNFLYRFLNFRNNEKACDTGGFKVHIRQSMLRIFLKEIVLHWIFSQKFRNTEADADYIVISLTPHIDWALY
jgi:hypothetical protein